MADSGNGSPASQVGLTNDLLRYNYLNRRYLELNPHQGFQGYSIFDNPIDIIKKNRNDQDIAFKSTLDTYVNSGQLAFQQKTPGLFGQNVYQYDPIQQMKDNQMNNLNQSFDKIQADKNQQLFESLGSLGQLVGQTIGNSYKVKHAFTDGTLLAKTPNLKFKNKLINNTGLTSQGIGVASTLLTGLAGEKSEYSGDFGQYTQSIDKATDTVANAMLATGTPWGAIGGLAIKGTNLLGQGLNKLGAGTDGMTRADAILGSGIMSPMFWWNGAFGKRTRDFIQDKETMEQIGSSYGGLQYNINEALSKSNKKYGILSKNAMSRANEQIGRTTEMQNTAATIAENAATRNDLVNSMSEFNSLKKQRDMEPQFNASVIRSKEGGILKPTYPNLTLKPAYPQFQDGGKINKLEYQEWVKDVNPEYLNSNYDLETAFKYYPREQLERWKFAVNSDNPEYYMNLQDKDGNYPFHLGSIVEIPETGEYMFLKLGKEQDNLELIPELEYYQNSDFKDKYDLIYDGIRYWYKPKTPKILKHGGSVNIIPNGALHARLHHLNIDNITTKGIPVVSEKEDGTLEQQAEIEHSEIILRLEVTKKLEEMANAYYASETSERKKNYIAVEAGKILTDEILYNTQDNIGLLK